MKRRNLTILTLVLCLLLSACGGASKSEVYQNAAGAPAADMAVAETWSAAEEPMDNGLVMEESGAQQTAPENRKWIVTMDISAETEDLDTMLEALAEQIKALNGYVENQSIRNGSKYDQSRYRRAGLTVRIPADQVDAFARELEGYSNVVRSSKNLEDVTLRYVATESRVKALQTEEERLLELMSQAENMSDLLEIEGRLTDVRYELEQMTSQLRVYDNLVDYATVNLNIEEVTEYTPVEKETVWQRISGGFLRSLKGVGEGLVEFGIWIIVNSPYLVLIAACAVLGFWLGKKFKLKKRAKKSLPKAPQDQSKEDNKE